MQSSTSPARSARVVTLSIKLAGVWLLVSCTCAITAGAPDNERSCPATPLSPVMAATKEQAQLKVLVPNIRSLRQFVNCSDPARVRGFCIDVFEMALSILLPSSSASPNMSIHYSCFNFTGNASSGPTYNDMVDLVANGTYDAVVGDVTIGSSRSSKVDFTHHYMESGVVILGKIAYEATPLWLFFGWPFSLRMWCTILGAFFFAGFLVCSLERKDNPEFAQGSLGQRAYKISW
ncbi:hypothetical protein GOP47_0008729 [Adiantum capillus-veneris]|uniref:Ionotropic glutamate receptor L-glutamate and glycine-binding domain-containing protein n=1 Tax=Adiantum capillus-veneris TaxID=13818 RepID=A0A9D4UZ76_ADICA|nr:hypothetical protein GOP47_0008729 [Adiantum capillus-veneris]